MGRKGHGRYGKHSRRDRRKKKGGIISTVILIVAICVFAFSAFQLYKIFNGYHKGESEYNDLVKLAVTEDKGEQENGTDDQDGSRFSVNFDAPQWAVTPGQSAVFYKGDVCLGGGIIDNNSKE